MQDSDHYESDSDWDSHQQMITPAELTNHINSTLMNCTPPGSPLRKSPSPARKTTSPLACRKGKKSPSPARVNVSKPPPLDSGGSYNINNNASDTTTRNVSSYDSDISEQLLIELQHFKALSVQHQQTIKVLEEEKLNSLQALSSVHSACNLLRSRQRELDVEVQDLSGMLRLKHELLQSKEVRLQQQDQAVRMLQRRVGDLEAKSGSDQRELRYLRLKLQQQNEYISHLIGSNKARATDAATSASMAKAPPRSPVRVSFPHTAPTATPTATPSAAPTAAHTAPTAAPTADPTAAPTAAVVSSKSNSVHGTNNCKNCSERAHSSAAAAAPDADAATAEATHSTSDISLQTHEKSMGAASSESAPAPRVLSAADQKLLALRTQMRKYIAEDMAQETGNLAPAVSDFDSEYEGEDAGGDEMTGVAKENAIEDRSSTLFSDKWDSQPTPPANPNHDPASAGDEHWDRYGDVKTGLIKGTPPNELIRQNLVRAQYQDFTIDSMDQGPESKMDSMPVHDKTPTSMLMSSEQQQQEQEQEVGPRKAPIAFDLIKGTPPNELIRQNLVRAQYQKNRSHSAVRGDPISPAPLTVLTAVTPIATNTSSAGGSNVAAVSLNEKIRQNNLLVHRMPSPSITHTSMHPRSRAGTPIQSPAVAARQAAAEAAHHKKLRGGGDSRRSPGLYASRPRSVGASSGASAAHPLVSFMRNEGRNSRSNTPSQRTPGTPTRTNTGTGNGAGAGTRSTPRNSINSFNNSTGSNTTLSDDPGPDRDPGGSTSTDRGTVRGHVLSRLIDGSVPPNELIRQNNAKFRANYI